MPIIVVPSTGGTAASDSIVIPQSGLANYGLTNAELTNDAAGVGRVMLALMRRVYDFDFTGVLGIARAATQGFTAVANGIINRAFTLTFNTYNQLGQTAHKVFPLPTIGTQAGQGGLPFTSLFPSSTLVLPNAAISGGALLVPYSDLALFNPPTLNTINLSNDSRDLIFSIFGYLGTNLTTRTTQVASAITARTFTNDNFSIPATFTATPNPLSGIEPTDIVRTTGTTWTFSTTIQTIENQTNDTYDVRVINA